MPARIAAGTTRAPAAAALRRGQGLLPLKIAAQLGDDGPGARGCASAHASKLVFCSSETCAVVRGPQRRLPSRPRKLWLHCWSCDEAGVWWLHCWPCDEAGLCCPPLPLLPLQPPLLLHPQFPKEHALVAILGFVLRMPWRMPTPISTLPALPLPPRRPLAFPVRLCDAARGSSHSSHSCSWHCCSTAAPIDYAEPKTAGLACLCLAWPACA